MLSTDSIAGYYMTPKDRTIIIKDIISMLEFMELQTSFRVDNLG